LTAAGAHELGIVDELHDDVHSLIAGAVRRVDILATRRSRLPDSPVAVPPVDDALLRQLQDGKKFSPEVSAIMAAAIAQAAAATSFAQALETGYEAFGASGCTAAAREGISAFLEGRVPDFGKTD
jgi:enoyl-CoA hydratase/3-hydroxyacyl-CoA dehydrogenase